MLLISVFWMLVMIYVLIHDSVRDVLKEVRSHKNSVCDSLKSIEGEGANCLK